MPEEVELPVAPPARLEAWLAADDAALEREDAREEADEAALDAEA